MSRRKNATSILLTAPALALVVGMVGCSNPSEPLRNSELMALSKASKTIKSVDLGEVPGGLIDPKSELTPLLGDGGKIFSAVMLIDSSVVTDVEKKKSCPVKAGTPMGMVAKNGNYLRVLVEALCENQLSQVEGFVLLADVKEVVPEESTVANKNDSGNSTVMVASQAVAKQVATPVPTAAPVPSYPGCFIIEVTLNSVPCEGISTADYYKAGVYTGKPITFKPSMKPGLWLPTAYTYCAIPGNMFRQPALYPGFGLRVNGDAARWDVTVSGPGAYGAASIDGAKSRKGANEHIIRMSDVLPMNNAGFSSYQAFNVRGFDASGNPVGGTCTYSAQLASPIVLDLANTGMFNGYKLGESKAKFDLFGTGERAQIGWIKPDMGLLALDRNANGVIDNGGELFGESTRLSDGKKASNGYAALVEIDENKDGSITSADPKFEKLSVWVDANSDGYTDKGELHSLASLQIKRIGVAYSPSLRHSTGGLFENDVRYESRYWGPAKCGDLGCLSFDVYFATMKKVVASNNK